MKKIGFVGYDSTDIVLYLARLRSQDGGKVAVVDMTEEREFISMLRLTTETPEKDTYKNIHIVIKEHVSDVMDADYVFFYYGRRVNGSKKNELTDFVMVTDMIPTNARSLRDIEVPDKVTNEILLIRNIISAKFTTKVLVKLSEHSVAEEYVCLLPYDESDYRARCYMCIDTRASLNKLSDGMQDALYRLYELLFEPVGRKKYKEMMRKA